MCMELSVMWPRVFPHASFEFILTGQVTILYIILSVPPHFEKRIDVPDINGNTNYLLAGIHHFWNPINKELIGKHKKHVENVRIGYHMGMNILGGKNPWGECPGVNVYGGKYPGVNTRVKCPRGVYPMVLARGRFPDAQQFDAWYLWPNDWRRKNVLVHSTSKLYLCNSVIVGIVL